ncbi:hypothetical protein [Dactylosporangium sp. CA-092794]|uniref:hypothetical protein n=1 Tax=Dactylosporangium sp. CA-092794 TaxID=3239929 RepID=UPI003D8FDEC2
MSDWLYGRHRAPRGRPIWRSVAQTVLVVATALALGMVMAGSSGTETPRTTETGTPEVAPPPAADVAAPADHIPASGAPDGLGPATLAADTSAIPPPASAAGAPAANGVVTGAVGGGAPTRTTAAAPPPPPPPPPAFAPISVQAENGGNTLYGGAEATGCDTCDGGARVRYVGGENRVVIHATANVAGTRTVTVLYETDGVRILKIAINDGSPRVVRLDGTSWTAPLQLTFTATIPAGAVNVSFFNDEGPAPDVDKLTIT